MPIELKGSCHCGSVTFSLQSSTAVPYQVSFITVSQTGSAETGNNSFVFAPFAERLAE
jgi:hypothetical protein